MTKIEKVILAAILVIFMFVGVSVAYIGHQISQHGLKTFAECIWEGGEKCE